MATTQSDLQSLVTSFVTQLVSTIERATAERARAAILAAVGDASLPRRRGRPPKNGLPFSVLSAGKFSPSRRRPKQLCPVPGCNNVAAPVFGMVCSTHKAVPKAKIKAYRAARRKAKAKA